jgi:phosphoglycerate dehydrogenase-like enzyme
MISRAGPDLHIVATIEPDVDESAAKNAGVHVETLQPPYVVLKQAVAEYAVTLMMMLVRNMLAVARSAGQPWAPGRDSPALTNQSTYVYNWPALEGSGFLRGKVVGVVGAGTIGRTVAQMLTPFGVRLLYTQRHRLPAGDEQSLGLEWREFDDLLRESDIITLHHKFQEGPGGNEGQFGAREFAMMKSTAVLINTSRGRMVDEEALTAALRNGDIAGVALDVMQYEPAPKDHPLLSLAGDNVIISPHIASGSETEYWRYTLRALVDAYDGVSRSIEAL